jgi:hypothetical protein
VNLTPEKDLVRELRKIDRLPKDERFDVLSGFRPTASDAVRSLIAAESSTVGEFKYYLKSVPNFALTILRKRIAMPADGRIFSTSKLAMLDAAIRKAHSSLACPICKVRQQAKGLHLHRCVLDSHRALTAREMAEAKLKAGLPVGARLVKALAGGAL